MRRLTCVLLGLAAVGCAGASAANRVGVRIAGRPAAVTVGTPWTVHLVVTPASAGRPVLVARGPGAGRRTFRATRVARGRYRVRGVLPAPGSWRLEARLGRRTFRLGSVTARAPVAAADVEEPFAVAVDADGSVLIADRAANRIWRVRPGSAERASIAEVREPIDVAVGPNGHVYAVSANRIVRISAGAVTTVAGTGERAFSGDGGPATQATLNAPDSLAFDGAGNLYVAEYENRVRRLDASTGTIATVAGTGAEGYGGDGGQATAAVISHPHGLAVAVDGTMFIADTWNHRIRRVDTAGVITTVAGTGAEGDGGDGGPATRALFNDPVHVALGPDGSLYVTDGSNNRVRRIGFDGVVRTVAGGGLPGASGDGGPATRARLDLPNQVTVAPDGTFYIAEFEGRRVRRVDAGTGVITTIAR
jgi:sugar lactone lactonase YvrE